MNHHKTRKLLFAFLVALMMSGIMSLIISILNVGLVSDILGIWLKAWGGSFVIALPAIAIVIPTANKLVGLILKE